MSVQDFANVMGVETNIAYAFLRFLAEKGLIRTTKRPQPAGKKGKPTTLYHLGELKPDDLGAYLTKTLTNNFGTTTLSEGNNAE